MILKYNKFISTLNEQQGWDEVKNSLGKLLSDIDSELKNDVSNLTNKLMNNGDSNRIKNIISVFFKNHEQKLKSIINDSDSLNKLNINVKDNLKSIYGSIISINNMVDDFTFEKIFNESPQNIKRLFDKDEKKFDKNVKLFSINLISELSSKFGYDKNNVFNNLSNEEALSDEEQKEQISKAIGEEIEVQDNNNLNKLKSEILKWFNQVIYNRIDDFIRRI